MKLKDGKNQFRTARPAGSVILERTRRTTAIGIVAANFVVFPDQIFLIRVVNAASFAISTDRIVERRCD